MVPYCPPKRKLRTREPSVKALITDLPDELLLQITALLTKTELLQLRLSHTALAPACLTEIQGRTKVLYIHPSAGVLRRIPEICDHPFTWQVEEVILLGHVPRPEIDEALKSDHAGRHLRSKFATWPLNLPTGKRVAQISNEEVGQTLTYDVLVESLRKIPQCKRISYQTYCPEPGINKMQRSSIERFSKKYMHAPQDDARASDMEMLLNLLTDPALDFTALSIKTTLPMAPQGFSMNLQKLTHLELALDLYSDTHHVYWTEQHKYQETCEGLLKFATNLESLTLVLVGTGKIKKARDMESHALNLVKLTDRTWKNLKHLRLSQWQDDWHRPPQRPACQIFRDLEVLKAFFRRHTQSLETAEVENILFVEETPTGPSAIQTMISIIDIFREARVPCEYVVNRFRHHEYCKRKEFDGVAECGCDCARYTPENVDGGTTLGDFERLVECVGLGGGDGVAEWLDVETGEREWTFGWREDEDAEEGLEELREGVDGLHVEMV